MDKFFLTLVAFLLLAVGAMADDLSAPTTYGTFGAWEWSDTIAIGAASDTVYGAETLTIFTKESFDDKYEWAISLDLATAAADSLQFEYIAYNRKDSVIAQAMFDTVGASATGWQGVIPFGNTLLCNKATVRAIGWIGSKKASVYSGDLWKRKRRVK